MKRRHPRLFLAAGVSGLILLAVALAVFEPWRLFTNTTVHEALPTVSPATSSATSPAAGPAVSPAATPATPATPVTLATGSFVTHEHSTTGTVRLLRLPDGSRVLRLENLATSDGPALHVWLSDQPVRTTRDSWGAFDDGSYLDLGDLKGNHGDQNYPVPANADLTRLTSVSVWCARFHVSFGAAALTPPA